MYIYAEDTAQMATICAQLAREGVTFEAYPRTGYSGQWQIKLTGGF